MLHGSKQDDGVINLRHEPKNPHDAEFKISHVEEAPAGPVGSVQSAPVSELEMAAMKPYDKVKVKFDKFVNLVATHAYEDIFDKHMDEDVIISTDLLTDLANAHEEKSDKKVSLIFVVGILLGLVVAWFLLK